MMNFMIPKLMQAVIVSAVAVLLIAENAIPANAQDGEESPVEAREDVELEEAFVPPLTGAPVKRMGAASRKLGPTKLPCPEVATDETESDECAEETAHDRVSEDQEAGETTQ